MYINNHYNALVFSIRVLALVDSSEGENCDPASHPEEILATMHEIRCIGEDRMCVFSYVIIFFYVCMRVWETFLIHNFIRAASG